MDRTEKSPTRGDGPNELHIQQAPLVRTTGKYQLNVNLYLALHRYFTLKLFSEVVLQNLENVIDLCILADLGFYFEIDQQKLCCNFCNYNISVEALKAKLNNANDQGVSITQDMKVNRGCRISNADSKNVPMGNINSCLSYKFEAHRLYSLLKKDKWDHVNPLDLARSGFYYNGDKNDEVTCIFCNVTVKDWEEGDTPDGEHRKWNYNCPFMNEKNSVGNVQIGSEPTTMSHDGIGIPAKDNTFVTFVHYGDRLRSFDSLTHWPLLQPTTGDLASAGHYLIIDPINSNRTKCYNCGYERKLEDWQSGDLPTEKHDKSCLHTVNQIALLM